MTDWLARLEAARRLAGPRRHLRDRLGSEVVAFLEEEGILRERGISPTFPCTGRPGNLCGRAVVRIDDAYHAVCGEGPAGCRDLLLSADDVALLAIDMLRLARAIGHALGIRGSPARLSDLPDIHRVGSLVPQPGLRYPVFLAIRSSARSYAEVLGALASRQDGGPFAVLVPTAQHVSEDLTASLRVRRALLIVLDDVLAVEGGRLVARADPRRLFAGVGIGGMSSVGMSAAIVARAIVQDGGPPHRWVDLDDAAYRELLAAADRYDVLADERQRRVWKGTKVTTGVPPSHFRAIQAALNTRGYFDPVLADPELDSAKQIFQRARATFDPRSGRSHWKLFKTVRTDEKHVVYAFQPDPDVSFAFIFVPDA